MEQTKRSMRSVKDHRLAKRARLKFEKCKKEKKSNQRVVVRTCPLVDACVHKWVNALS